MQLGERQAVSEACHSGLNHLQQSTNRHTATSSHAIANLTEASCVIVIPDVVVHAL